MNGRAVFALLIWAIIFTLALSGCSTSPKHREGCGQDPALLTPVYKFRTVLVRCDSGLLKYVEVPIENI